jgi:hypothetical protein
LFENQLNINWHLCGNLSCSGKFKLYVELKYLDGSNSRYLLLNNWYPDNNIQILNLPEEYINYDFEVNIFIDDIKVYNNILYSEK